MSMFNALILYCLVDHWRDFRFFFSKKKHHVCLVIRWKWILVNTAHTSTSTHTHTLNWTVNVASTQIMANSKATDANVMVTILEIKLTKMENNCIHNTHAQDTHTDGGRLLFAPVAHSRFISAWKKLCFHLSSMHAMGKSNGNGEKKTSCFGCVVFLICTSLTCLEKKWCFDWIECNQNHTSNDAHSTQWLQLLLFFALLFQKTLCPAQNWPSMLCIVCSRSQSISSVTANIPFKIVVVVLFLVSTTGRNTRFYAHTLTSEHIIFQWYENPSWLDLQRNRARDNNNGSTSTNSNNNKLNITCTLTTEN